MFRRFSKAVYVFVVTILYFHIFLTLSDMFKKNSKTDMLKNLLSPSLLSLSTSKPVSIVIQSCIR